MLIECKSCEMYQSQHCDDCLVSALLHPAEGPIDVADDLDPPLRALSEAGLIPVLRFRPRNAGDEDEGDATAASA